MGIPLIVKISFNLFVQGQLESSTESDMAKSLELFVESGLHPSQCSHVRLCTLHGVLFLLQSLTVDAITSLIGIVTDFVMGELARIQLKITDILTERCNSTDRSTVI